MTEFQRVDFAPEVYEGDSQTIRRIRRGYQRMRADEFNDEPADLTPRQMNFYRNLMSLAIATASRHLPVDFEARDGQPMYLDRGCIKIAEHARFIRRLRNDAQGTVGQITLNWLVRRSTR